MQKKQFKKLLSLIVCIVLVAAIALFTTACNDNKDDTGTTTPPETSSSQAESTELGQGDTKFTFIVTDADGKNTTFQIKTDKETVGEALMELKLIEGEEGPYGIYVKTVNGITYDYDKDQKYWAFYEGDNYGAQGAELTQIKDGATYSFRVE